MTQIHTSCCYRHEKTPGEIQATAVAHREDRAHNLEASETLTDADYGFNELKTFLTAVCMQTNISSMKRKRRSAHAGFTGGNRYELVSKVKQITVNKRSNYTVINEPNIENCGNADKDAAFMLLCLFLSSV